MVINQLLLILTSFLIEMIDKSIKININYAVLQDRNDYFEFSVDLHNNGSQKTNELHLSQAFSSFLPA